MVPVSEKELKETYRIMKTSLLKNSTQKCIPFLVDFIETEMIIVM